jgi:hypothetical protein
MTVSGLSPEDKSEQPLPREQRKLIMKVWVTEKLRSEFLDLGTIFILLKKIILALLGIELRASCMLSQC